MLSKNWTKENTEFFSFTSPSVHGSYFKGSSKHSNQYPERHTTIYSCLRIFQTVLNDSLAKQHMAQTAATITPHNASIAWCNEPGTQSYYCFPCRSKDYSSIFSLKSGARAWQYWSKMWKTAHIGRRVRRGKWGKGCKEKEKSKERKEK